MRNSKISYLPLAALLVVVLVVARASAQQQLPAAADSLTESARKETDVSQDLHRVLVDSLSPRVLARLVESINPVVVPNNTRLTLTPTARSLKPGSGYVESMMLFLWSVGYGVSDRHAILGGASLIPGLALDKQLLYFGTKSSIYRSESVQLAAGLMTLDQKHFDDRLSALYGVATLGDSDAALSLFVAYGFEGSDMADHPIAVLGGEKRLGRRTYFVGELPFYRNKPRFSFLGLRRYSENGDSHWDLGYPYLSYSFGFGGD